MKGLKSKGIVALALLACLIVGQGVYGATKTPGSAEDPLVTLSLVEQKLSQLKFYVDERLKSVPKEQQGGTALEVVELKPGEKLIGQSGTEIILRAGDAVTIASSLGGLADVTGAKDLQHNDVVPANHLLIVPRDDQRGVSAKSNVVLMVRGGYTVQP